MKRAPGPPTASPICEVGETFEVLAAKRLAGEAARAASRVIVSWKTLRAGMGLLPLAILMRKPGGGSVAESSGGVMDKALVWAEGES